MEITSAQNPRIKQAVKLKNTKERKKTGLILIEGEKEISSAITAGIEIKVLFYAEELAKGEKIKMGGNKTIQVSKNIFQKMAYRENPDGFLAIGVTKKIELSEIKLKENPLLVILESVEKPGNLGAILRSADAAGADAVIIADPKTDVYNPNVIRASLGTVFTNQVATVSNKEALAWLKEKGIKSFAATPSTNKLYTKVDFKNSSAIVIGTEDKGLSEEWLRAADEKIKIPMAGKIDSLNASVSAAIILFEAVRQRNID